MSDRIRPDVNTRAGIFSLLFLDMSDFESFKDWFPHSNFCMAGGLEGTLVAGRVISRRGYDHG